MSNNKFTVALIGSFRKHYDLVLSTAQMFSEHEFKITSPQCTPVSSGGLFVRFESDDPNLSDAEIQSLTLRNIFAADLVYVVNPDGYIGRTTCYEVGRVMQRRQPLYFLSEPNDLPVEIPKSAIFLPEMLIKMLLNLDEPKWLYHDAIGAVADIEREL